jgi:hypothetical protein
MPSGFVEHEDGMTSWLDVLCDFVQMQLHRLDVAPGQDQADRLAFFRADRAEDVGRGSALVARGRGPRSPLGPAPSDLDLLSDPRLVGEPRDGIRLNP